MAGPGRPVLDVPSDLPSGMESFLADVVERHCGPYWDRIWEDVRAVRNLECLYALATGHMLYALEFASCCCSDVQETTS